MNSLRKSVRRGLLLGLALAVATGRADEPPSPFAVDIESGRSWVNVHHFAAPGSGTQIDARSAESRGGLQYRLGLTLHWRDDHAWQFVVAPFATEQHLITPVPLVFNGGVVRAHDYVEIRLKEDTYRLSYLYTFLRSGPWSLGTGAALHLQHLNLILFQGNTDARYEGTRVLPLILGRVKWQDASGWFSELGLEAFGLPSSSVWDVAWRVGKNWNGIRFSAAYRYFNGVTEMAELSHHLATHGFVLGLGAHW